MDRISTAWRAATHVKTCDGKKLSTVVREETAQDAFLLYELNEWEKIRDLQYFMEALRRRVRHGTAVQESDATLLHQPIGMRPPLKSLDASSKRADTLLSLPTTM